MKKMRFLMFISAAFATCALIISCSKNNSLQNPGEENGRREVMSGQKDIEESPTPVIAAPSPSYLMRLEDETLTLYEITGGEETAVTAVNIDPSYYPPEDIKELNKGVVAYSKEDGFARLENFTN